MSLDDEVTDEQLRSVIQAIDEQERENGSGHTSKDRLLPRLDQISNDELGFILAVGLQRGYLRHVTESGDWTPTAEGFGLIGK